MYLFSILRAGPFSISVRCIGTSYLAPARIPGGISVCICMPASVKIR